MRTVNEYFTSGYAKDPFGHWIIMTKDEAEAFVDWLINESGMSNLDIINELKYQIDKPDAIWFSIFEDALNNIPVSCSQCGKFIKYGDANWITTRYSVERDSKVISRSLVGGSTVRRITNTHTPINECFCVDCLEERRIKYKQEKEGKSIQNFFKRLFGK